MSKHHLKVSVCLTGAALFWTRTRSGTLSVSAATMTPSLSQQIFLALSQIVVPKRRHFRRGKAQAFLMLGKQLAGSEIRYRCLLPPKG